MFTYHRNADPDAIIAKNNYPTTKIKKLQERISTSKLCTTDEHTLIKNFRLLSPDGQERILHQCNYEVSLLKQEKHA